MVSIREVEEVGLQPTDFGLVLEHWFSFSDGTADSGVGVGGGL